MLLFLILLIICKVNAEVIKTKSGPVKGFEQTIMHLPIQTFRNIPYAKPPVKELRFQVPMEVDKWNSIDDLKQHGEIYCPQFPYYKTQRKENEAFGQEDCLLLDVHRRHKEIGQPQEKALKPVIVYFHGGRFSHGSKDEYGPYFLLRQADIIIVIPNYRLGILGFLSIEGSVIPGNFGLWDQKMALKWISENVEAFGGDPTKVTIAGHDAGGVSVGFHVLSPHSNVNFSAAISGSGTALDPWAMTSKTRSNDDAMKVARGLKCSTSSNYDMLSCLKSRPWEDILRLQSNLVNATFLPTVDKSFLPDSPHNLYANGYQKKIPYLAGVTKDEASVEVLREFPRAMQLNHMDKIILHYLQPYLYDSANLDSIVKAAKYHYLRGVVLSDFSEMAPYVSHMMSDFLYLSSLKKTLQLHSQTSEKISEKSFMYVFTHKGSTSLASLYGLSGRYLGVSHMEDVIYLFNTTFANWTASDKNSHTKSTIETLVKMWTTFMNISFSSTDFLWSPFAVNESNGEISEGVEAKANYRKNDTEFWSILVPDLQNISISNSKDDYKVLRSESNPVTWGVAGLAILLAVVCVALVGVVIVTRRKLQSSILPLPSSEDMQVKYSKI